MTQGAVKISDDTSPLGDRTPLASVDPSAPSEIGKMTELQVFDKTGKPVREGDTITDFRGQDHVFRFLSSNRLIPGKTPKVLTGDGFEFYASVFDLTVREVEV
jgi:hypothetical protein